MASPAAKTVIHVAGFATCGFYRRAHSVVSSLSLLFPTRLEVVKHEFPTREEYREWLIHGTNFRGGVSEIEGNARAGGHSSSPFCWLADSARGDLDAVTRFVGGCDDTLDWCRKFSSPSDDAAKPTASMAPDGHAPGHGYDYDLIVIGGGSGGLAASKEAASFGAKVAVLDYVKPSPHGTKWGLGGTCVNVGCIPKKLMHNAANLTIAARADLPHYGVGVSKEQAEEWLMMGMSNDNGEVGENWDIMRQNIQNHIRGLNFKYRVNLREKNVTYLNQLGTFLDDHTLETTDKKGNKGTVTFSRCLIAVGGRPTPLTCEGGELAISSDDIWTHDHPGKVLCVGASYISLECAGFGQGIAKDGDVTVAVRSILLRGFDRECADLVGKHMKEEGIKFREGVVPTKLEKAGERIKVTFSDGDSDEYDTVVGAIGRTGDTAKLGLEKVGIKPNPKNGKIPAKFEQTSVPNIYVVGDVTEGCDELTPVAIQAGKFLARRLFGGSTVPMDYRNVCTTVFTPLEYSCVGYSEEDALAEFGKENIVVYHKFFKPLEWSLSPSRHTDGFTKCIVDKHTDRVLGLHYLGPNAGEVMQGFGTAMRLGVKFGDIADTVGIHPTTAEEITTLTIKKGSGEDPSATGC